MTACGSCKGTGFCHDWFNGTLRMTMPIERCRECGGTGALDFLPIAVNRAADGIMRFRREIEAARRRAEFRVVEGVSREAEGG